MAVLRSVVDRLTFILKVFWGLALAITSNEDILMLAVSAALLSFSATRWVGAVTLVWCIFRRLDQYVNAFMSK